MCGALYVQADLTSENQMDFAHPNRRGSGCVVFYSQKTWSNQHGCSSSAPFGLLESGRSTQTIAAAA
jgi:hypothetical protein